MKILVCDKMDEQAILGLKNLQGAEVTIKTGMDIETLNATIADYEIVIVRSGTKIRKKTIDVAGKLKAIIRGGVGLDNIDVAYARSKNIDVRNTPKASSISVAELAIASMLCLARNLTNADKSMKEGKWEKQKFKGCELFGKTLCVIGSGNIGTETGTRAHALGMKVKYTDLMFRGHEAAVHRAMKVACRVTADVSFGAEVDIVGFDEAISKADFITMHVPFDKEHGAVLKKEEFAKMKDGVIIINAARGGVIEESALVEALKSKKVAAAAIDVYEKEPSDNSELINLPNVLCTPHIGALTKEGQARVGSEVVAITKEYL